MLNFKPFMEGEQLDSQILFPLGKILNKKANYLLVL